METGVWTPELELLVKERAMAVGFDAVGVADVSEQSDGSRDAERFAAWIVAGRAGEMEYLKRRDDLGTLVRSRVQVAIPWAESVVVCAWNYNAGGPKSITAAESGAGWIARYAWSGRCADDESDGSGSLMPTDYHEELLQRLRAIEETLRERVECETRCYVDTGPIVERTIAVRAGIGWVGKNTCVISQGLGSWLLLGVVVTSLRVAPSARMKVAEDRCGSCTRCIDACPTAALVAPREMDASRCIAYLTIEKKGTIAEELRASMGRQVFGCDICQDVCPWNRRSPIAVKEGSAARSELMNPDLGWLAEMDAGAFRRWFKGSPLERTRRKRLHRNVAIAMGNSGERRFLEQLQKWRAGDDEVLAESASWALARIEQQTGEQGMV